MSALKTRSGPHVAGPMITGIASGTTAMSSPSSRSTGLTFGFMSDTAERKSNAPAPMRNASTLIPNTRKMTCPKAKRIIVMTHADSATLFASRPRSFAVRSGVMARNMDNAKNGVVKKKYFNSVSTKSVIISPASSAKSENTIYSD